MLRFSNYLPSYRVPKSFEPGMSPARTSVGTCSVVRPDSPFSGLVICVTGLSKEARKQVKVATERLGGLYSPHLHPRCTHLVVQSFCGRKFEYAIKYAPKNALYVVTLGWFVDSVKRNVRLSESLYTVKGTGDGNTGTGNVNQMVEFGDAENYCFPTSISTQEGRELEKAEEFGPLSHGRMSASSVGPMTLSGQSFFIDSDISTELRDKVVEASAREGATVVDEWFIGCNASHVVCEATSVARYLGHSSNLVTPLWVLKTLKEGSFQRLVHLSADLARQLGIMLENCRIETDIEDLDGSSIVQDCQKRGIKIGQTERKQLVNLAKLGVRNRRRQRVQKCEDPVKPITPSSLLESICWSVSEPTSTASVYTEAFSSEVDGNCQKPTIFNSIDDAMDSEASFANFIRPLSESEKNELVFKHPFLTILFPIDRFAEIGPSSRTFFSDKGFTCIQLLDNIYAFYQENMLSHEIEVAIHTDSRHADRLRSSYASEEHVKHGYVTFKRIDFLGSRRSFEMLKQVRGDNNSNVYELFIRA